MLSFNCYKSKPQSELPNQQNYCVETLEARIKELEGEKSTLEANAIEAARTIERDRVKKEELQRELENWQMGNQSLEQERDAIKSELSAHKIQYQWLFEIAEKQRKALSEYVLIEQCTIKMVLIPDERPYLIFDFSVINNSVYTVSLTDSIGGFIKFKGQPLDKEARIWGKMMENCLHKEKGSFMIRQPLNVDEVTLISETLKKSGNLFDLSELIVTAFIAGEERAEKPFRLDLTLGMQRADLENKIIVLENELNQVRQESKEKERRAHRTLAMTTVIVIGKAFYEELDNEQPIRDARLANWRKYAMDTVTINFGRDVAISNFGRDEYTPPNTVQEQRQWLIDYVNKLGDLETNQ